MLFKRKIIQCFLSHCSDDHELVTGLNDILLSCFSKGKYDFFNTSAEERSTYAGDGRSDALRHALNESELMIAVITDSYLRSTICVSEISAFWFINKPVIPLVYSKNGIQFLKDLMGEDIIYIYPGEDSDSDPASSAKKIVKTMIERGFCPDDSDECERRFAAFFRDFRQAAPTRSFIGTNREMYLNINQYC